MAGWNSETLTGPLHPYTVGSGFQALAAMGPAFLMLDGNGNLYEADQATLSQYSETFTTQSSPESRTCQQGHRLCRQQQRRDAQVFQVTQPLADGGFTVSSGGIGLGAGARGTPGGATADGGSAQYMAKLGNNLFVSDFKRGVVDEVDVTDAGSPGYVRTHDLNGLPLHNFPSQTSTPAPWGIATFQNKVYVAMKNENLSTSTITGDGRLGSSTLEQLRVGGGPRL